MFEETLAPFGYKNVHFIDHNARCQKAMADAYDGPKFLKMQRGDDEYDCLRREVAFNECVRTQTHALTPFFVPRSRYMEKGQIRIAEFERINARWLNEIGIFTGSYTDRYQPFNDQDLEQIYLAIRHLRSLPRRILPKLLVSPVAPSIVSTKGYVHYLHKWITSAETRRPDAMIWRRVREMVEGIEETPISLCLTHGDMVPKNFGRMAGGQLVIVDAEFADWRFSWTDAVRMMAEMWTRENRPEAARKAFRYIVQRHRAERVVNDDSEILFLLKYFVVEYFEKSTRVDSYKADLHRTYDLFACVVDGGIEAVIAT